MLYWRTSYLSYRGRSTSSSKTLLNNSLQLRECVKSYRKGFCGLPGWHGHPSVVLAVFIEATPHPQTAVFVFLASQRSGSRDSIGFTTVIRISIIVIDGNEDTRVVGGICAGEADQVGAGVGA